MSYEELTVRVRAVIAQTQRVPHENVTADSTFQELGVDSLDAINIIFALESEFNIDIPVDVDQEMRSVREVIDGLAKLLGAQRDGTQGNQAAVSA
jgi:acyl carrier protein